LVGKKPGLIGKANLQILDINDMYDHYNRLPCGAVLACYILIHLLIDSFESVRLPFLYFFI